MVKRVLTFMLVLIASISMWAQTVTINESAGWLESAYVKWQPVSGATSYNVYYSGNGITDQKIDNQLIRSYGTYFRADVLGLAAGTYSIKVAPVISGVEGTGITTGDLTVGAHDRNGFAFQGGHIPSAYNIDGTPKTGAVILYITENTKNTVSMTVTGATANPCVGLQTILDGFKKGKDTRPLIVRFIGNITDLSYLTNGDLYVSNANNAAGSFTFEGVGDDAVTNGWSFCLKTAANVEIRNFAAMNNNSTNGDDFGLQQDNDHIWIHNNEMYYGNAGSDADQIKGDGAMDVKLSTYITISYNHFVDNGKCSLLGLSEGTTTGLYITYHHNWFDHSDSRHPRVRFYSAHVYNNYYDGIAKYGAGSTLGSSLFVEGNYYRNAKHPMMTSLQGTDVWNETTLKNDPNNLGTFSGEAGGTIKAFNNTFDASIGTNNMRFVAYGDPNPAYNIAGVISSTIDFDAYVAANRGDQVPATVKSFSGANVYNNFDTDATLYVKTLVPDAPDVAKAKTMQYAGRTNGGDIKWTFNNTVDDAAYLVNAPLKALVTNYTTKLVSVQGETSTTNSQTLTTTTDNSQTVVSGVAISDMLFTWGGGATDATVTGLPGSGITVVKDATAKTITISGTPSANISFSITTSGSTGTSVTLSGSITILSSQTLTLTSANNSDQTVTSGTAIAPIVYTWGGDATDASVSGLPVSGIDFVKDASAKTITISGTPTATVTYSIATTGTAGTPATGSGTITMSAPVNMVHNFTISGKTSTFYTIIGNMNSTDGSVSFGGLTLTKRLKIETAPTTSIAFTTTKEGILTLVFDATFTGTIKVNTTAYTAVAGIVTATLPAGSYSITKGSTTNLFYMSVVYTSTGTGIHNTEVSGLTLYPNPVKNSLSISSGAELNKVEIYSLTGILVKRAEGNNTTIDMSQLNKGSYLVKVFTGQGNFTQKMIKE
ncbi:MAG: T9SS type A sorting domain-containing protein [Paludibacter sp.]|nr:T9SS type A sorting domain-containing protein [Paludibacter sp.]